MLLNDLYTVISKEKLSEMTTEFVLRINAAHDIFKGHFPEQPVMPGVCQMQILTEVASDILERELKLKEASNIKFLAMLDPRTCGELTLQVEVKSQTEEAVKIIGKLYTEEHIYLKFRGVFQ